MADNEANRDEALKCVSIASRALEDGDVERAEKFVLKGQRLFSCKEVDVMAARIEAVKAGGSGTPRSANGSPHTAHSNGTSSGAHQQSHGASHRAHAARSNGPSTAPNQRQGDPAGMGGSRRSAPEAGVRKRAAHSHAPEKPPVDENAGTPEQRKMVADILKAKDLYEILGLPRSCTDDDIKKAYRKLALKLHPDKNSAAHAEEAFKAVSKAFSCLSDGDKRAYYDRTGYESTAAASAAAASQQQQCRTHAGPAGMYYDTDFDPEEIFNMFFGSGLQSQIFRAQFGVPRRAQHAHAHGYAQGQRRQEQGAERHPSHAMMVGLMQLMPVILLIFFSFFSMLNTSNYSLARDSQFRDQLHTTRLNVPFYVKSQHDFERSYSPRTSNRVKIEQEVERDYYERLGQRCQSERLSKQRLMYSWTTREDARKMRLPSCEEIDRINEKLGIPVRAY